MQVAKVSLLFHPLAPPPSLELKTAASSPPPSKAKEGGHGSILSNGRTSGRGRTVFRGALCRSLSGALPPSPSSQSIFSHGRSARARPRSSSFCATAAAAPPSSSSPLASSANGRPFANLRPALKTPPLLPSPLSSILDAVRERFLHRFFPSPPSFLPSFLPPPPSSASVPRA